MGAGAYSIGSAPKNHAKVRSWIENPSHERWKMALDIFLIFALFCKNTTSVWEDKMCVVARQDVCCGKTKCVFCQDKMCVVERQDVCCGETRSLFWQAIREAAFGRLPM